MFKKVVVRDDPVSGSRSIRIEDASPDDLKGYSIVDLVEPREVLFCADILDELVINADVIARNVDDLLKKIENVFNTTKQISAPREVFVVIELLEKICLDQNYRYKHLCDEVGGVIECQALCFRR